MIAPAARMAVASLVTGLVAGLGVLAPTPAEAAPNLCNYVRATRVAGFDYGRLPIKRVCRQSLSWGAAGSASMATSTITVHYSRRTTPREVSKATLHEMTHQVEYRTTPAQRKALYSYLGIKHSGSYFAFNDAWYYNGSMSRWKASPRERLAESVVNCSYGTPNHSGMKLVPRAKCGAFLKQYRGALSVAR